MLAGDRRDGRVVAVGNVRPGERQVPLLDGRLVSNYSEAYRAECEARHVLTLPNVHARRLYLGDVAKRRGEVAGKALGDLVRKVWAHNRQP